MISTGWKWDRDRFFLLLKYFAFEKRERHKQSIKLALNDPICCFDKQYCLQRFQRLDLLELVPSYPADSQLRDTEVKLLPYDDSDHISECNWDLAADLAWPWPGSAVVKAPTRWATQAAQEVIAPSMPGKNKYDTYSHIHLAAMSRNHHIHLSGVLSPLTVKGGGNEQQ